MKKICLKILSCFLVIVIVLLGAPLNNKKGVNLSANAAPADIMMDVVLVVDVSGSMSGTDMTNAKAAAKAICEDLFNYSSNVKIGIVSFASSAKKYDFSDNKDSCLSIINGLSATGSSYVVKGLTLAETLMESARDWSTKSVVIISDGAFNESDSTVKTAAAAVASYCNVVSLGVGVSSSDESIMKSIATQGYYAYSGGSVSQSLLDSLKTGYVTPAFSEEQLEVLDKLAFDVNTILSDINLGGGSLNFPSLPIDGDDKDLGSLEASVNLPIGANLTYSVDLDEKRIKILIGLEDDQSAVIGPDGQTTSYWSESYQDVKNMYQNVTGKKVDTTKLWNQFSSLRGQMKKLDCSMGIGVSAKIAGYVELDYATNELVFQEGGVVLAVDSEVGFNSNTYPYPGLFVGFGIKPGIGGTLKVSNQNNALVFNGNIDGDLAAHIELGIGEPKVVKTYIKGGVEGTIGASYSFPAATLAEGFSAYLSARAYAESKVFGFEVYSDSWDLGKVTLYPTEDTASLSSVDDIILENPQYYLSAATPVTRTYNTNLYSTGDSFCLENIYYDSAPQLIELDSGKMMLVWTGDDGTKTDKNRTSIFYSVFDGTAWTTTQKITNNDCYNSTPVVTEYDGEIYVIWQRTNNPISAGTQLVDVLSDVDLYYSVYKDGAFSNERIICENKGVAELSYTATPTAEGLAVFWIENSENDIYGETGTNILKKVVIDTESNVSEPLVVAEAAVPFGDYAVFDNGALNVVYTISYSGYEEMYHYSATETKTLLSSNKGITSVFYDGVQIVYTDGGQIKTYNLETCENKVLVDDVGFSCSFFKDGETVFAVTNHRMGDQYYINAIEYDPSSNTVLSDSNIYRSDKYIVDYDVVVNDSSEYIVAMNSCKFDINATEIFSDYTLSVNYGQQYEDISVNNVAWCYDDISSLTAGDSATINFEVKNLGNSNIDEFNYKLVNVSTGETIDSGVVVTDLSAGDVKQHSVAYTIPESFEGCDVRIDVSLEGLEQNPGDNSAYVALGLADVELYDVTSDYIDGDVYVTCKVKNSGYATAKGLRLEVYDRGKSGTKIHSLTLDDLAYNTEKIVSFVLPENYCASIDENELYSIELSVLCDNLEEDNDNNDYVYVYENLLPFSFELDEDGSGLTITGYSGTSSIVDIPEMISGVYVKKIKSGFMNGNSYAKTINIPSTIETIDARIFNGATALSEIIVDDESVNYCDIDGILYNYDKTKIIRVPEAYSEEDFDFWDSVTEIGDYAFYGCSNFSSITIPEHITYIGSAAFSNCTNLLSVYITDIKAWCEIEFYNYSSNPVYYAENLYLDGDLVTNLILTDNITSIGDYAFCGYEKLSSISFTDSVISIGESVFEECTGLTSVVLPNSVTNIGPHAFRYCINLAEVNLPNSAVSIEKYAFAETAITELTLPENIASLGNCAFSECDRLERINYNARNCSMGANNIFLAMLNHPFKNSSNITTVTIGESVESIPSQMFYGRGSITSVYTTDLEHWCNIDFGGINANPLAFAENFYLNGELVTDLVIPDGVETIKNYAFYKGACFDSVTIPDSITSIGTSAFAYCDGLTSVAIPGSVSSIGAQAFRYCDYLDTVVLENGVTSIGANAFADCAVLNKIEIPNSVKIIDATAFTNNTETTIHCYYNAYAYTFAIENSIDFVLLDLIPLNNSYIDYTNKYIFIESEASSNIYNDIGIDKDSDLELFVIPSYMKKGKQFFGTGSTVYIYNKSAPVENYSLVVIGDTNGDSVCDVLDCVDVEKTSNGNADLTGVYAEAGDINGDDVINVNDYSAIVNKALAS